jgi:hypothetical protein
MSNHLFKVLKGDYFEQYPLDIQDSSDPDFRGLANRINLLRDELVNRYQGRDLDLTIEDMDSIYVPERSHSKTLEYLAYMVTYDFDRSRPLRDLRKEVFEKTKQNKRTGTVNFLLERVEEITGIIPELVIRKDKAFVGWDQNSTIDGSPENVNFFGGIAWDQNNVFSIFEYFQWFVKSDIIFLDIKSNGVFDPTPSVNQNILNKAYAAIARNKDAATVINVGYINSGTGAKVSLIYIFSRDVMHSTDTPPSGSINNQDQGIEY